ncbi:MAG: glycosyltransferase family 4 protein [Verrucomicrobiales bacterium]
MPALLRAFAELRDYEDLHLVICSSSKPKQARALAKLAERLGVAEKVRWLFQLDRAELAAWVGHAAAAAAPLTESPRNLEQGCCPLKVLEAMAAGIPVVASDLPVTRELIEDGATGHLARAGRPGDLAMALRLVLEYPEQAAAMGKAAQEAVRQRFTWEQNRAATRDFFRRLTMSP